MTSVSFPSKVGLATLMVAFLLIIAATMLALYIVLVRIELQSALSFEHPPDDVALEENDGDEGDNKSTDNKSSKMKDESGGKGGNDDIVERRLHLPMYRRAILAAVVFITAFMTYLLLSLSNANVVLRWIGMFVVLALLVRQSIFEEVRRERLDRLAAIFSLVLVLAMALNLAVYANRQHAQGDIYEGKARIVGYDYSSYKQDRNDTILRTDLEVAWGRWWGCPNMPPDTTCQAFVSGALCEAKEEDTNSRKRQLLLTHHQPRRQKGRTLPHTRQSIVARERKAVEDSEDSNDNQGSGTNTSSPESEDLAAENAELEKVNEELEKENAELEQQNENLEGEIEEYKDYEEEEEADIEELDEEMYDFDDDYYESGYWAETQWGGVWGEYACEDLFYSDVEEQTFDENDPPGNDDWPFINIYGNCDTCDAYIVDYYSTQHFQSILSYKKAGLNYGILAGLSLIGTAILMVRQKASGGGKSPADREIELLPAAAGGSLA